MWPPFFPEMSLPRFAEPIPNVTVTIGRDALLACVVDNLRGFKVSGVGVMDYFSEDYWIRGRGTRPEIEFLCLHIRAQSAPQIYEIPILRIALPNRLMNNNISFRRSRSGTQWHSLLPLCTLESRNFPPA